PASSRMNGHCTTRHSCPTRRSSALLAVHGEEPVDVHAGRQVEPRRLEHRRPEQAVEVGDVATDEVMNLGRRVPPPVVELFAGARSEEHTSELQSREDLVCRLLLDKK